MCYRSQRPTALLPALLAATLLLSGCLYSREIAHTRREIERQYPEAEFEREVIVSLGPASLRVLGWIAGLVPEDEAQMASSYLRDVSRVKVGVYRTAYLPSLDGLNLAQLRRFREEGWEVAVKTREEQEMVWVLYRERRDTVRDLYVFVLSEEDLVLARVQGHLGRLLERVLADHSFLLEIDQ